MTREEAQVKTNHIAAYVIEKIYDDIESSVCENCLFYEKQEGVCVNNKSPLYQECVREDYGCNIFEREIKT